MTRICEKFVEDLSSGLTELTGEMQAHLLTCPDCQQALAAVKLLKQQRKPMTGKEALAIAALLKAVKIEAAAGAASAVVTTPQASIIGKVILAAFVSFAILFAGSSINKMQNDTPKPLSVIEKPVSELKQTVASPTEDVITTEPQVFITYAGEDLQSASATVDPASPSASLTNKNQPDNSHEKENPEQPKTMMVSPDQEEVDPR